MTPPVPWVFSASRVANEAKWFDPVLDLEPARGVTAGSRCYAYGELGVLSRLTSPSPKR
jgi:hypothetical protein